MTISSHSRMPTRSGFTLLEVLLVVAILGIIATFAIMEMKPVQVIDDANRQLASGQVIKIANAVNLYRLHTNRLPTKLEDLKTNPGVNGWRGPYHQSSLTDPFGEPYIYTVSGRDFEISSNAGGSEGGPISSKDP